MLAGATDWLAERSRKTLLVSRHATAFSRNAGRLSCLDVNWTDRQFLSRVESACDDIPDIKTALLWLHHLENLLPGILQFSSATRIVVILGSRDQIPHELLPDSRIVSVHLGSKTTNSGRRWLTHEEICEGAIAALSDGQSRKVGEMAPAQ